MTMKVRYTVVDGEVIAEKRSGVRKQYVPDSLGSTVALLDNTQTPTDTFSYWPYGEVASRTGTTPTPFQYVGTLGCRQDSGSKTYMRARVLDPPKGRWLTEDPIGFDGEDWNLYRYVENKPTLSQDPSGNKVKISCNDKGNKERIRIHLKDVCKRRIPLMPSIKLRECLKIRCNNIIINCQDKTQGFCIPDPNEITLGYTPGHPKTYRDTIFLCSPLFNRVHKKCIGQLILHEMIHSCANLGAPEGDKPHQQVDCLARVAYPPDLGCPD